MSLLDYIEHGPETLVETAVRRLQEHENHPNVAIAYSGGKDSVAVDELCTIAGIDAPRIYSVTPDPPELHKFIRSQGDRITWHRSGVPFFGVIPSKKYPPTRLVKYCCEYAKHSWGHNGLVITGIRWEESRGRSKRRMVENCTTSPGRRFLNPIIDWNLDQLWWFIDTYNIPYCELYDELGRSARLGCVGCPASSNQAREFKRWPKYEAAWKRAIKKCFEQNKPTHRSYLYDKWDTWEDMWHWWVSGGEEYQDDDIQECFRLTDQ